MKEEDQDFNVKDNLLNQKYVDLPTTIKLSEQFFSQTLKKFKDYKQEDPKFENPSTIEALVLIL